MSERVFAMRLECRYAQPDNAVEYLRVEQQVGNLWQPFDLQVRTPGFDIFVYAMLACQHTYFRLNCAERGLVLANGRGSIRLGSDAAWNLESVHLDFTGTLLAGEATSQDIDYLIERMGACPVSRNVVEVADTEVVVEFE
jgi:hypothetical protein